ncbi:fibronectin type III-like domain-contianing protein [Streptomyces sp. NPDC018693]|uniref:fibronectin type III-like domain-contianing protein n=1 Tax=unclassified Streptomyces TaxID=2593676 RepID=UPI003797280B
MRPEVGSAAIQSASAASTMCASAHVLVFLVLMYCSFAKVALAPGASITVEIALDRRAFAYWDISRDDWTVAPGRYQVHLADNAHDVVATAVLDLPGDTLARPLTLDSPVRDWFGHPVVRPALTSAMLSGLTAARCALTRSGPPTRLAARPPTSPCRSGTGSPPASDRPSAPADHHVPCRSGRTPEHPHRTASH